MSILQWLNYKPAFFGETLRGDAMSVCECERERKGERGPIFLTVQRVIFFFRYVTFYMHLLSCLNFSKFLSFQKLFLHFRNKESALPSFLPIHVIGPILVMECY